MVERYGIDVWQIRRTKVKEKTFGISLPVNTLYQKAVQQSIYRRCQLDSSLLFGLGDAPIPTVPANARIHVYNSYTFFFFPWLFTFLALTKWGFLVCQTEILKRTKKWIDTLKLFSSVTSRLICFLLFFFLSGNLISSD